MKQRETDKIFDAASAAKEFIKITNKFINYLITLDELLDKSKLQDVIDSLVAMQSHAEEYARFNEYLPDRVVLAEEKLLEPIIEQQKLLDKISREVEVKLSAHIEVSRKINQLINIKLKQQIANEVGYDAMGKIDTSLKNFDPKVCLT
ncbi:MAG: hypothetical protein SFT68_00620, partial [Rickettsiaceae bacterium]|nr:hypothetical protein [Rickettsiaceae bacterium]